MLTAVTVRIPVPARADGGDALQLYSDFGSGTVDLTRPLLAKPVAVFGAYTHRTPRASRYSAQGSPRTGRPGQLMESAATQIDPKGGLKLFSEYVELTVFIPPVYGWVTFAARLVDAAGNEQSGTLPEIAVFVSASDPPTLRRFDFAGYDAAADGVTFSFELNHELARSHKGTKG